MTTVYITTTIPYVNARPHLGFALELVQADVLARHHRGTGGQVRFQSGTDDNSLKNVLAAQAAGIGVREFVDASAAAFTGLAGPLLLSVDDVIRTSSDPRHAAGVERLWRACAARGDLYRKPYEGLYCVGCEQFYTPAELDEGRCPDHGTVPDLVSEVNWFFRLSRYAGQLRGLIADGAIRIEPAGRRNEVLALIDAGLDDFSVSRSTERARGWGIPVPGDPGQVIYVWWDALGNYLTALDYADDGENFGRWWAGASRRVQLLGKGVLRFHAVYWPAILLSAGEALPTDIVVHGYLTEHGRKISKSSGATVDPYDLVGRYGTDAVRWWLLREVPRGGDADFTVDRLVSRANDELANGFGNLVNRVVALIHRYRDGQAPAGPAAARGGAPAPPLSAAPWRTPRNRSPRRSTTSTSARPRRRSGRSPTRPTATSTAPDHGNCPGPARTRSSTPCCRRFCWPARPSARTWRRSCRMPRRASPASARPTMTGSSRPPPRSCPGSPSPLRRQGHRSACRAGMSVARSSIRLLT